MPVVWVAVAIALMLVLVLRVKLDAFLALILTSFAIGLLDGMDVLAVLQSVLQSVLRGVGGTLGNVVLILVFGAMLGKLVDESGAAHAITYRLKERFGRRHIQLAMALSGA